MGEQQYQEILVVDLLGGIGDLLMLLPAIHGLARRNPHAALRVLTHEPGADLIRGDSAVTEVRTPGHGRPGAEREAVIDAIVSRRPDLAVTTTRYDGIPDLLLRSGARCVTDLWRRPPRDELVGARYLRILHAEGLLDREDVGTLPRVSLRPAELDDGERAVADRLPAVAERPPVVLIADAGMAVKRWPQRRWRQLTRILSQRGHPVLGVTPIPGLAVTVLPDGSLRQLAACFAAVARRGGVVVGADTGPVRLAAAAGAYTVALFGPTSARRYGIGATTWANLQGLPLCPHRRPTAITEQICWWGGECPLSPTEPACMADISAGSVAAAVTDLTSPGA